MQTAEYMEYISELVKMGEIMTKRFYAVVTYHPTSPGKKGFFNQLTNIFKLSESIQLSVKKLEKYKEELFQRIELVTAALSSMGVNSTLIDTESLIELYYNSYNPQISEEQKLGELEKVQVERSE